MALSKSLKRAFWMIGLLFIFLVAGLGVILKIAFEHQTPILDEAYYEKGLNWQTYKDRYRRAAKEGWKLQGQIFDQSVLDRSKNPQTVVVDLLGPAPAVGKLKDAGDSGLKLTLVLERPASTKDRQIVELKPSPFNKKDRLRYQGELRVPGPGRWELVVSADIDDKRSLYRRHFLQSN